MACCRAIMEEGSIKKEYQHTFERQKFRDRGQLSCKHLNLLSWYWSSYTDLSSHRVLFLRLWLWWQLFWAILHSCSSTRIWKKWAKSSECSWTTQRFSDYGQWFYLTDGFVFTITIKCIGTGEELLRVQLIINNIIPFKHEAWGETVVNQFDITSTRIAFTFTGVSSPPPFYVWTRCTQWHSS
jgi:hypothetical protein